MSHLSHDVYTCAEGMYDLGQTMKGHLHALRQMKLSPEAMQEVTNAYSVMCGLTAQCNRMKSILAAARMTGNVEAGETQAQDLELHPVNHDAREVGRGGVPAYTGERSPMEVLQEMRHSLHRVGDHTLDSEEGVEEA